MDIKITKLKCKKCGYIWFPRREELPKICPRCKSPNWNKDKVRKYSKRKGIKFDSPKNNKV